jgi:hypothetical protein
MKNTENTKKPKIVKNSKKQWKHTNRTGGEILGKVWNQEIGKWWNSVVLQCDFSALRGVLAESFIDECNVC